MRFIVFFVGLTALSNAIAQDNPDDPVIIEKTRSIFFAPEDVAGEYKFQITESGNVFFTDNKGNTTYFSELAPNIISKIKVSIDRIKSFDLKKDEGIPCEDGGSEVLKVYRDGQYQTIWKWSSCLQSYPVDKNADFLYYSITLLQNSFNAFNR